MRSRHTSVGRALSSCAHAALPVPASETSKSSFSRYFRSSLRISGSSSTTRTVFGGDEGKGLARAASGDHHRHRAEDEIEIARQAPVIDVLHVEVHPLLEGDL